MSLVWKLDQEVRKISFSPAYAAITGSLNAGILLAQLAYWFRPSKLGKSKLRVEKGGRQLLAKTRSDLMKETGLTDWRLRAALDRLKDLGLVTTSVHLFNNQTAVHFDLNTDHLETLLLGYLHSHSNDHKQDFLVLIKPQIQTGGNITSGTDETSNPYNTEITTENTSEIVAGEKPAKQKTVEKDLKEVEKKKPIKKGTPMATLKEILENNAKATKQEKPVKLNPKALAARWNETLGETFGGFQKQLTQKEIGQLKMLGQRLGSTAPAVLDWAITHWGKFAFETKAATGKTVAPEKPHIGFLLEHYHIAETLLWIKESNFGPTKKPELQSIAKIPKAPKQETASDEMVQAAIKKFTKGKP